MNRFFTILAFFFVASCVEASDYQFRPQFHVQKTGREGRLGIGTWAVLPDATAEKPKLLLVAGPLLKRPGYWVEFMGGSFVDEVGTVDPVLDIRASVRAGKWSVFAEGLRVFETRRTIFLASATHPLAKRVRVGGEVEYHIRSSGELLAGGPRVEILLDRKATGRIKLATSYQWDDGSGEVLRNYLVFTW